MDALLGISHKDWKTLQKIDGNDVDVEYRFQKKNLTSISRLTSFFKRFDDKKIMHKIDNIQIEKPVFILGHWRSGTTLLHNILSLDEQFGFPTKFQISNPHTFLSREKRIEKMMMNRQAEKRHMDNMEVTFSSPDEDETAISMMCQRSPIISWAFPRNHKYYTRYHTFDNVPAEDVEKWKEALILFYKKLTFKYERPLVLKSPVHLGRMKMLLDIFPDAKFIHIYRNPYRVFQSTKKLYATALPHTALQRPNFDEWNRHIIDDYSTMYEAFWRDKQNVPEDRLFEISFEDLEKDIFLHIANIYEKFEIPQFSRFEPVLLKYLESIKEYKKNTFPELPQQDISEINKSWTSTFENLNYDMLQS